MLTDVIETGASTAGNIDVELSPVTYDALIEATLGGTSDGGVSINEGHASIDSSGNLTAIAPFSAPFGKAFKGQWLLFTGWGEEANNGWKQIVDISGAPNSVKIGGTTIAETSVTSGNVSGRTITNGVEERSFSIEESYADVGMYRLFRGMRAASMNLKLSAGAIITGTFNFMGTQTHVEDCSDGSTPSWLGAGTRQAVSATPVLNATANVGDIRIDGDLSMACFKALEITIDNTLREVRCLGSKFPGYINYGLQRVTGSFTKMFADWRTYEKMVNHADISLSFGVYNDVGGVHVHLPRVKLTASTINLSGGLDSDVQKSVEFTAIRSLDASHQIRVDVAKKPGSYEFYLITSDGQQFNTPAGNFYIRP
jgi:hypothetical protein